MERRKYLRLEQRRNAEFPYRRTLSRSSSRGRSERGADGRWEGILHVGSTAVGGLDAKPTIDMLIQGEQPAVSEYLGYMAAKRARKRRQARRSEHAQHVGPGGHERAPEPSDLAASSLRVDRTQPRTPANEFHITVASLSMDGEGLELAVELELVKAALLYADRVTLASPKALFALSAAGLAYGDPEDRAETTLATLQATQDLPFADLYKVLKAKPHRTRAELQLLGRLESAVAEASDGMREALDPMLENSRLEELVPALEAGLLEVDALGADRLDTDADDFLDQVFESLLMRLRSSMSSSASAHPMYDDSAGGLLRAMLQEGQIDNPTVKLANEVGVARGLIATVEGFPRAPMDVVLDVRNRLQGPLVRFRAAVADASRELGEDDSVLTPGFQARVSDIYRRTVAPELMTIQEALEELKVLPTLRRAAPTIAESGARGAVGAGLALLTGAVDAVDLTALAVLAGAGAKAAAEERAYRAQDATARKENRFFWLYEADRQLGP